MRQPGLCHRQGVLQELQGAAGSCWGLPGWQQSRAGAWVLVTMGGRGCLLWRPGSVAPQTRLGRPTAPRPPPDPTRHPCAPQVLLPAANFSDIPVTPLEDAVAFFSGAAPAPAPSPASGDGDKVVAAATTGAAGVAGTVAGGVQKGVNATLGGISTAAGAVGGGLSTAANAVGGFFAGVGPQASAGVDKATDAVLGGLTTAQQAVTNATTKAAGAVSGAAQTAVNAVANAGKTAVDSIKNFFG